MSIGVTMKKILIIVIFCLILIIPSLQPVGSTPSSNKATQLQTYPIYNNNDRNQNKIHDNLEQILTTETKVPVFVSYENTPASADVAALANVGVTTVYKCKYVDVIVTGEIAIDEIALILNLPGVLFIEASPDIKPLLDTSTPAVKARESAEYSPDTAWELGYTGKGITIAVLDTGVDDGHPSLTDKFVAGADFAGAAGRVTTKDGSYNPDDDTGHGTTVAGIAIGTGGADEIYKGVAPDAKLIDVRLTLGRGGDIMSALDWCIDNRNTDWNNDGPDDHDGIDIISISIGGDEDSDGSDPVSQLVNRVAEAGIVIVTAIGNSGPDNQGIGNVAAADKVICVGNLDDHNTIARDDDDIAFTSTRGPRRDDGDSDPYDELKPDVVAPGMDITAPQYNIVGQRGSGYSSSSGSSMSCPHVSGICALMLEANPDLNPQEIKYILQETAEPKGDPDLPEFSDKYNYAYGYGSVDAYEAVIIAEGYEPSNHKPEITSLSASPRSVKPNEDSTITTTANDEDGDDIYYNYSTTGGSFSGSGPKVTWTAPDEIGEYEITAVVNDGQLFSNPVKVNITVETEPTNHAPEIDDIKVDETQLQSGEDTAIKVTASDPDNDELFYEYDATGGVITGTGASVVWTAPGTSGKYTISIKVNDGELYSGTEKVVITVEGGGENKPPVIETISASAERVAIGDTVWLSVQAYDPEMGKLQYTYSPTDGTITGSGAVVNWTAPFHAGGFIIEVTVTDEAQLSDFDEIFIEVYEPNFPPIIVEKKAHPDNIISDGTNEVLFTIMVMDLNGLGDIAKVTLDLSGLFGSESQKLYDNGRHGDEITDDGVYSYSFLVPSGISGGTKKIAITAQDYSDEKMTDYLTLDIVAASEDEDKDEKLLDFLPIPGFEGMFSVLALLLMTLMIAVGRSKLNEKKRKRS